ncbi:MAG: [Solobacterium sp.]|nr:[citrate (pro-3S)-lyase] ligase [Solobacterium sp.]
MDYYMTEIRPEHKTLLAGVDRLLEAEGIRRDAHLDYIGALIDENGEIAATGSCFGNTLRCFAVSSSHQGEGLLNQVITHLIDVQAGRGNFHLFLYTKPSTAKFFQDLGFHEIASVPGKLVFMENRRSGFESYLRRLERTRTDGRSAAIVMNANPFTLGHRYLAETAAASCDTLHIFIVSEDLSFFPFSVRKRLVQEGLADLPNVILHDCGPYIISAATFPGYFLKDEQSVAEGQARLDLAVFARIAEVLDIKERWVGEEHNSAVTSLYNTIMAEELPKAGIACRILPRKETDGMVISASTVRQCLQKDDWTTLAKLVPATTLAWLKSDEAIPVIGAIKAAADVVHH